PAASVLLRRMPSAPGPRARVSVPYEPRSELGGHAPVGLTVAAADLEGRHVAERAMHSDARSDVPADGASRDRRIAGSPGQEHASVRAQPEAGQEGVAISDPCLKHDREDSAGE